MKRPLLTRDGTLGPRLTASAAAGLLAATLTLTALLNTAGCCSSEHCASPPPTNPTPLITNPAPSLMPTHSTVTPSVGGVG